VLFFAALALLAYPVLPSFRENIGTAPNSLRFSLRACLVCWEGGPAAEEGEDLVCMHGEGERAGGGVKCELSRLVRVNARCERANARK